MIKRLLVLAFLFILFFTNAIAQRAVRYKYEAVFGLGAGNCLCELGGANQIGTHFLKDFDLVASRISFSAAMRYKVNPYFSVKGGAYYTRLNGDDKNTAEPFRHNRNLNFRSPVAGVEIHFEGHIVKEQSGRKYYLKNAQGFKNFHMETYFFVGIGVAYFNPQGKYVQNFNTTWINLRTLGTEGQGMPGMPGFYSPVLVSIPVGIGGKIAIDRSWSIGIEYGMRYTNTDYLDDVSTLYYDNVAISTTRGSIAAYLADPTLGKYTEGKPNTAGQIRGDPKHKDAYMVMNITLSYKIKQRRRSRAKF